MKIYTSYYAKVARQNNDNYLLVRVSNTKPTWFKEITYTVNPDIYPDWPTIDAYKNGEIAYKEFKTIYVRGLVSKVQPEFIYQELQNLSRIYGKENIVLLCWEKDPTTCHRTILADLVSKGDYVGEL